MSRYALKIAYDGTDYFGFQVQPSVATIQGAVEKALFDFSGVDVRVAGAGRTDAGVHATAQVVTFDLPVSADGATVMRAMNALMPRSISVVDVAEVDASFHARFSAVSRTYKYLVRNSLVAHPLASRYSAFDSRDLDFELLSLACKQFVGVKDFGAFSRVREDQSPVREVVACGASRVGDLFVIEITAQSFLHQMVRGLMLCALEVAAGRRSLEWIDELFAGVGRVPSVAVPQGLCLTGVGYDPSVFTGPELSWPVGVDV